MISIEPKKGSVWTQKASWRDFVGGAVSTPFSISQEVAEHQSMTNSSSKC
jgi:hypothetical protein